MLQDSGRSRVIACHSREIGNLLLDYYHSENMKMVERKMVTGQGYGLGIGGCKRLCPMANEHSLVTLFPCLCQLRIGRCIGC